MTSKLWWVEINFELTIVLFEFPFQQIEGQKFSYRFTQTKIFKALNATFNPNVPDDCDKLTKFSDEFWGCLARHYTQTIYHPAGTTKMGPKSDRMSVVDPQLRVYGVRNLRVVDCGIMPTIVSGNF